MKTNKLYTASYLPENPLPLELEEAFEQNANFRQLMQIPDKLLFNKDSFKKAKSRFKSN
jgi:hypothetical protein